MKAPKDETRINAGRIFSIILESAPSKEFATEVLEMLDNMKSKVIISLIHMLCQMCTICFLLFIQFYCSIRSSNYHSLYALFFFI